MYAVIGLGNPGERYQRTRHNVGFLVVDELARRHDGPRFAAVGPMLVSRAAIAGAPALLVKPLTWMNRSGVAVAALRDAHDVAADELIVVHDDLDLTPGTVRVKRGGGSGGHNGLKSILALGDAGFTRVRLGVGRSGQAVDAADWVLEPLADGELDDVTAMVARAADAVEAVVADGAERAMNQFNRRAPPFDDGSDAPAAEGSDRSPV